MVLGTKTINNSRTTKPIAKKIIINKNNLTTIVINGILVSPTYTISFINTSCM